jgi:hypothetical protein
MTRRTYTERRLDAALAEWVKEQTHARPGVDDAAVLADLRLRMDAKLAATFKAAFPTITTPN